MTLTDGKKMDGLVNIIGAKVINPMATVSAPNAKISFGEKDININSNSKYTVSFDSDGGSIIPDQIVEENGKAIVPETPTKDGYTFIEWQLDGNKYDFDSVIKKDIILKAIWKEKIDNNDNDNNSHVKESNASSNNTTDKAPIRYNYTGKYFWNDRYIQLNSDNSCIINPSDVGTAGSVNGSCTYSMDLCSNPNACEAQITRIAFYDNGNYAMEGTIDNSNKISFVVAVDADTGELEKLIFMK